MAWARPVHEGKPEAAPKRMTDVVQVGDVVMIEPPAVQAESATLRAAVACQRQDAAPLLPPSVNRATLRQIPLVQGALVSLDPQTGRVLAMVGGWSYEQSQFNRVTQAQSPARLQLQTDGLPDRAPEAA